MKVSDFWFALRLELGRGPGRPHVGRFFREIWRKPSDWRWTRPRPSFPDSPLLFVVITENHLPHLQPVAKQLAAQGQTFGVLFTDRILCEKHQNHWPGAAFPLGAFCTRTDYIRAIFFSAKLLPSAIFSGETNVSALIRFGKTCFLIHRITKRLLQRGGKKVALFKADGFQANAVLMACREAGVASFAIQHGLIGDTAQNRQLAVDTYLVWSEFFKERLERWQAGCAIQVTGNAAYDRVFRQLQNRPAARQGAAFTLLMLPNAGISHTPPEQVLGLLDAGLFWAKSAPDCRLLVKPHPADTPGLVEKYLSEKWRQIPNVELLHRSEKPPYTQADAVALVNSGTGLEACVWGLPLVVFAPNWESVMVKQYVEAGVALFADSVEAFVASIQKIKSEPAAYRAQCTAFAAEQLAFQGRAAERIAAVLSS